MASFCFPSSSPSSLQLRFGCRSRQSSRAFVGVRYRTYIRRFPTCFSSLSEGGGRRDAMKSWSDANGSPDSFAGWGDEGIDGDESKKKGSFGGIVSMGLAGVLFAAGVTFASFSLTNIRTTATKQQMEPLTMEHEILLSSDNTIGKDGNIGENSVSILQTESKMIGKNSNNEKGTNNDLIPSSKIEEDDSQRSGNIQESETPLLKNVNSSEESFTILKSASVHNDIKRATEFNIDPVPAGFSYRPSELSEDTTVSSSGISLLKDLEVVTSSDTMKTATMHNVIIGTTDYHVDINSTDIDPSNQDNLSVLIINTKSETPLQFPSVINDQLLNRSLTSSVSRVESNDSIDSQYGFMDAEVTVISTSLAQNTETNLQPPLRNNTNHPEVHDIKGIDAEKAVKFNTSIDKEIMLQFQPMSASEEEKINESVLPVAYSSSESTDTSKKESDVKPNSESNRSSSFDSILPKKTFSHSGIPPPSLVSAAIEVPPTGKILVPPVVDRVQGQALAALQVLKVIEVDVQPGDLCTRREYARWLVSASSVLSRNIASKVYPAMYIENITELAFDDVTPNDPDFPYIQGLAEAGLLSSKLSISDLSGSKNVQQEKAFFFPNSPVSRQDLISWKIALERRELPEVDENYFCHYTRYLDVDKINPDAWSALVADLTSGEQSITSLAFGFTRLFQPDKPVTKAQAAIALATGNASELVSEELARIEAESLAETAVNTHNALVAEVEKDLNVSFEEELAREREKIETLEKLAEETRLELERLRKLREEEKIDLLRSQATVESEKEVLLRLRHEVEEQLQSIMSNKTEISFERERINKLRDEVEIENQIIAKLQCELEVERKALSMARAWAEDEAKRAREQARALEEARERWEKHGLKIVVDKDLQSDQSFEPAGFTVREQSQIEAIDRGEKLVKRLKGMAAEIKLRSSVFIQNIIKKIDAYISSLKKQVLEAFRHSANFQNAMVSKAKTSMKSLQEGASEFSSTIGNKGKKVVQDCRVGIEKIMQRFKS